MQIWVKRRDDLAGNFVKQVEKNREELVNLLTQLWDGNDKRIVGFGAAAKGTVLLNYCNLKHPFISYVVDGTPYKQNKFIPGVNIPIYSEEKLLSEPPGTIVLILAWNFKQEIINKLKGKGFIFVTPVPTISWYADSNSR